MQKLSLLGVFLCSFTFVWSQGSLPEAAEDIAPLLPGELFPAEEVVGIDGQTTTITQVVKDEPAVVLFYRGGWCPYCNHHLAEVGELEEEIISAGFQIIAISPDRAEELQKTIDKNELKYRLFSDGDGALARAAGIAFRAPERYKNRLAEVSNQQNTGFLPVPAVFVLDKSGEILFEYVNPNYRQRMNGQMLLAVLRTLELEE